MDSLDTASGSSQAHCSPLKDSSSSVALLHSTADGPLGVINAARTSFRSESQEMGEKERKLGNYLWDNEHTSPFRHVYYTFRIVAPLFVFRQWMKYQVGSTWRTFEVGGQEVSLETFDHFYDIDKGCSWNEQSGRYKEFREEFYMPKDWRSPHRINKQGSEPAGHVESLEAERILHEAVQDAWTYYKKLLEWDIAREMARMVLPQNIYSTAYWTVSMQGLLHFLKQRTKEDAQWEIQQYALAIEQMLTEDLVALGIQDGQ